MKIITVVSARKVLENFANNTPSVKLSYWMSRFLRKTDGDNDFYNSKVQEVVQKYAVESDDGNRIIPPDKMAECQKDLLEIEDIDVEDPGIRFKLADLEELKMSMKQVYQLQDFIEE